MEMDGENHWTFTKIGGDYMFHEWLWWNIDVIPSINPETRWYANWQWPERLYR